MARKATASAAPVGQLGEIATAGEALRQFALNITSGDDDDLISLTIGDYLRILWGVATGLSFLTACNPLNADGSAELRTCTEMLAVIADGSDRIRTAFENDPVKTTDGRGLREVLGGIGRAAD